MDYTNHFRVTKRDTYFCGCDKEFDNIDDAICHYESGDIDGYCENGIRRNYVDSDVKKDTFECVCGKKGDWYDISENHHNILKRICMTERRRKENSYCKSCNLQCESVKNYEIHCMTEKHRRNAKGHTILSLNCDVCNIKCRGQIEMIAHLKTKKHLARLEAPPLELECKLCNIKCLSQKQIKAHLETKKHKKNESTLNNI